MQRQAITIGLCSDNGVLVVVWSPKPNAPVSQRAAVNVWKKLLDVRCDRRSAWGVRLSTAK